MRCSSKVSCDRGDVLLDGLVQLAAYLAVVALLCFEVVAIGVNMVQLDELAGDLARQAARSLPDTANPYVRQAVAEKQVRDSVADRPSVTVREVGVEGSGTVQVTLSRPPRTLLLRHVSPLAERLPQATTATGHAPTW